MKKTSTFLMRSGLLSTLWLLMCLLAFSQSRKITGRVIDAKDNSPLPGVTVQVKGTATGTQTQADGSFTLDAADGATLSFSFVGYIAQEKAIGAGPVNVALAPDVKSLQDVVVIGYGTQKRSDITGAVASIKAAQLEERPLPSVNQALAGRLPGVNVSENSGRPGGQTRVRIRGFSSINTSNNPLYIIDGVMLPVGTQTQNSNAIDFINPSDIGSVEVLKDASATAIYGSRGANGVVLLTTKRGSTTGGKITYDVNFGLPTIGPHRVKMLDANEFLFVEEQAYKNAQTYDPAGWAAGKYKDPVVKRMQYLEGNTAGKPELFRLDANGKPAPIYNTDWLKEATQSKLSQNHQVSFTNGNEKGSYGVFMGYLNDNGLLLNSYLKRYSARFTFDTEIKPWLSVGGNLSYNYQKENVVDIGTGGLNSVRMITEALPILPIKYKNGAWAGNYQYEGMEGGENPVNIMTNRFYEMVSQTVLGNFYANIHLAPGLELRSVLGTSVVNRDRSEYNGRNLNQISADQKGRAVLDDNREGFISTETYMTYTKKIADDHSITAMGGASWYLTNIKGFQTIGEGFQSDYLKFNSVGAATTFPTPSSRAARFAFNSYYGRINYAFKEKYLLTLTGRADGASKFGESNKYAFFPSAAVAWRISEEPFLKGNPTISHLKLRTSYGATGNSEINTYASLPLLGNYTSIFNDARAAGIGISRLANPDLKWERTKQADIGLEIGLLQNRISLEVDGYYRKTTDMLLEAPLPFSSGYATIIRNIGSMENKGIEIGINTVNIQTKDFTWSTSFNVSRNKNKVLSLATPAPLFSGNPGFTNPTGILKVGASVGSFWGLVREGTWASKDAAEAAKFASYRSSQKILPGDIKYRDVNGDYQINDADRMIIGDNNPDAYGSLINTFRYKNVELTIDLQYSYGADVLNMTHHSGEDRVAIANSFKSVLDAWTPEHQNTPIAALRDTRAGYVTNVDTRWVEDGSFLRGRNLLLAYTFPTDALKRWYLNKLRIYGSVQNFFLWTKFSGNDPEVTTYGEAFAQGQTFFDYPKPTRFTLGLNVGL